VTQRAEEPLERAYGTQAIRGSEHASGRVTGGRGE